MMMMISMSLTVAPTPQGTGARALIFTNSWKRGGEHQTPYQGFAPAPNYWTSVSHIP